MPRPRPSACDRRTRIFWPSTSPLSAMPANDGLISEADEVAGEVADKEVLDAAIIGSAQAVEHYEIARYGTVIAWAESVGHDDIVRLLNTNLNEREGGGQETLERGAAQGRQSQGGLVAAQHYGRSAQAAGAQ